MLRKQHGDCWIVFRRCQTDRRSVWYWNDIVRQWIPDLHFGTRKG